MGFIEILSDLEGRRVRVIIEEKRIFIETRSDRCLKHQSSY